MGKIKDLTGMRFGKLLVVRMNTRTVDTNGKLNEIVYHCECDCGNKCDVPARVLRTGNRKTCGCKYGPARVIGYQDPVFKDSFDDCLHRTNNCKYSLAGHCCRSCSWFDYCEDRCLNTPERCAK